MYIANSAGIFYNKNRSGVGLIINLRHSSRAILFEVNWLVCQLTKWHMWSCQGAPHRVEYKMIQKKTFGFPTSKGYQFASVTSLWFYLPPKWNLMQPDFWVCKSLTIPSCIMLIRKFLKILCISCAIIILVEIIICVWCIILVEIEWMIVCIVETQIVVHVI